MIGLILAAPGGVALDLSLSSRDLNWRVSRANVAPALPHSRALTCRIGHLGQSQAPVIPEQVSSGDGLQRPRQACPF